jgi:hypothetical protein
MIPKPGSTLRRNIAIYAAVLVAALCLSAGAATRAQTPPPAEADRDREAWRLDVPAYLVIGSGHPGARPSDITQPDGLEFTSAGLLLVTDSGNRRVQVWDVKAGERLGDFGEKYFGGEITNVTVAADGTVYVADSVLNLVYVFAPKAPKDGNPPDPRLVAYKFLGTRFGDAGFKKLGGMVVDGRNRLYVADGKLWEVRRYLPDGTADPAWKFTRTIAGGDTVLHRCEGMEIDAKRNLLLVASEADAVIKVFDLETGAFTRRLIGAPPDAEGRPTGKHVFAGSIEGLAVVPGYLLATDEEAGHIHVFDLAAADLFDADLAAYASHRAKGATAYVGFFGRTPHTNFDVDDSPNPDLDLKRRVDAGEVIPGNVNSVGQFCSPDEIAAYTDKATGETYIAVADQCDFRIVVYRWSDVLRSLKGRAR